MITHSICVVNFMSNNDIILAPSIFEQSTWRDENQRVRITLYKKWLADTGRDWFKPDLKAYRDYLLHDHISGHTEAPLSPASISAYVSTVRTRYRQLKKTLREPIWQHAQEMCIHQGFEPNPANIKAIADEIYLRWDMALDPKEAEVKQTEVQDVEDSKHLWLTIDQQIELIDAPHKHYDGNVALLPYRDTAMLALALCTGLREQELCDLQVDDLYQTLEGEPAVRVNSGKGKKKRVVPYGELVWCLDYVDSWLLEAGIESGRVFRGFDSRHVDDPHKGMTTRAVQLIVEKWSAFVSGIDRSATPHDLRRTYARTQRDLGMALEHIQRNLGHKRIQTTLLYIGNGNAQSRRPKAWKRK